MASQYISLVILAYMVAMVSGLDTTWYDAHATFYGDMSGGGTMEGACGYGNLFDQGYGLATAALSPALFNKGATCGACYEIKCVNDPKWCYGAASIIITATNLCPPSSGSSAWCNPPQKHFDLSMPMFTKLAPAKAGIIPVQYRRTTCAKKGGIKFQISANGNPNFDLILLYNVGGAGDVTSVKIKGSSTGWVPMTRNWGQRWQAGTVLTGQSISFQVTVSDGSMIQFDNVVPSSWKFGQTFDGRKNF